MTSRDTLETVRALRMAAAQIWSANRALGGHHPTADPHAALFSDAADLIEEQAALIASLQEQLRR